MDLYINAVEKNKEDYFCYMDKIKKDFDAVRFEENGNITLTLE